MFTVVVVSPSTVLVKLTPSLDLTTPYFVELLEPEPPVAVNSTFKLTIPIAIVRHEMVPDIEEDTEPMLSEPLNDQTPWLRGAGSVGVGVLAAGVVFESLLHADNKAAVPIRAVTKVTNFVDFGKV